MCTWVCTWVAQEAVGTDTVADGGWVRYRAAAVGIPKPPHPTFNALLICDHTIREEQTMKMSLIGIFFAIGSANFPVVHHSLSVYLSVGDAEGHYKLRLELLRSDTMQRIGRGESEVDVLDRRLPAEFVFVLQALAFDQPGRYQFDLYANDEWVGSQSFQVLQLKSTSGEPR
jgi:hypothetical protein